MKLLRLLAIFLAVVIALLVVIGLLLPRQWSVEVTTVTRATPAQVMPLVRDFREWTKWTTPMPETTYSYSDQQGQVASWMSWSGKGSRAKFIVTEVTDTKLRFDEQMESDQVNANGEITLVPEANGTRINWKDTGTLPPILGGYLRGLMENALQEHMKSGLVKLTQLAEASMVAAPPLVTPTAEVTADADVVAESADAGDAVEADAGVVPAAAAEVAEDAGATADAGVAP